MPLTFPERLLPQTAFKKFSINRWSKQHYLIRGTESKDLRDGVTGKIRADMVARPRDNLRDYSTSILGQFMVDDIHLMPTENCKLEQYFLKDWTQGEQVKKPDVPRDFIHNKDRGFFFLRTSACQGHIVKYDGDDPCTVVCKLMHTPKNWNFWHFSLRWFYNEHDVVDWDERARRKIMTAARTFLIERALFEEPSYEELDAEVYHR